MSSRGALAWQEAEPWLTAALHTLSGLVKGPAESAVISATVKVTEPVGSEPAPVTVAW